MNNRKEIPWEEHQSPCYMKDEKQTKNKNYILVKFRWNFTTLKKRKILKRLYRKEKWGFKLEVSQKHQGSILPIFQWKYEIICKNFKGFI